MSSLKLNTYILKSFAFVFAIIAVVQYCHPLQAAIAPERDVIILDKQEKFDNPSWKNIWDEARSLSREGDLVDAAKKYSKLLSVKPNIEEAQWEYCKVLIELKKWSDASLILGSLLEADPNRTDYILKAGIVALKNKQYQQALKYFGQVYQKGPYDAVAVEALNGLITGLQHLGKKKEIFPLLQQLYLREPNNKKVLLRLARLAKDLGWMDKAGSYYATLISRFKVGDQVLIEAATVYEKQGKKDKALYYQLKYLRIHSNYLPFQKKVADYYLKQGKNHLALPHLVILNQKGEGGDALLLQIAKIYLHEEDRPDKALFYLEKYHVKHPEDRTVSEEIVHTQTILANDLLSIVLNDGAVRLWKDLEKITPNRQAIFETMADLLKLRGKEKELFQILEILHIHNPQNKNITWRLANLLLRKKQYHKAYNYIKLLHGNEKEFPGYLTMRAHIEDKLGLHYAELETDIKILGGSPKDLKVRKKAMKLAGSLGLVNELQTLFAGGLREVNQPESKETLVKIYIEGLIDNRMLLQAKRSYQRFSKVLPKKDPWLVDLKLSIAEGFYKEGQVFLAEQMVREVLGGNVEVLKAFAELSQMAFEDGNIDWGKSWLFLLSEKTGVDLLAEDYRHWPLEVFYLKIDQLVAERQYDSAITMLNEYIEQLAVHPQKDVAKLKLRAEITLCRLLFKSKQYEKAKDRIHKLLDKYPNELEMLVLLEKIRDMKPDISSRENIAHYQDVLKLKASSKLKAAQYAYEYGALRKASDLVRSFLEEVPSSVTARTLNGKILKLQKKNRKALRTFISLAKEYPQEEYFHKQVLELEFKLGNFKKLIKEIPAELPAAGHEISNSTTKANEIDSGNDSYWRKLLLARALWAEGQLDKAIAIYKSLLKNSVQKEFLQKIKSVDADFRFPPLQRTFWEKLTFSHPDKNDSLARVMEPLFVGNHLGMPINSVTANIYEKYRWQKLIAKELSAKEAVKRRDYHQAEKEYKALIKRGNSDETLFDLAKIYSRLELYGREGELYDQLKKKGSEYPQMDYLAQHDALKRLPRVSLDYSFLNEKGKDGYIDIRKRSAAVEGWRMPAYNQEFDVRVERNYFISHDATQDIWTTKLKSSYTINLNDDTDLLLNLGGNFADSEANFLYKLEVKGRMSQSLIGNISISQSEVNDTVQALRDSIYYRDLDAGLKIDSVSRMFFGGDFRYRQYTDRNYQNRYHLWSSYDLFGQVSLLQLKYDFIALKNSRENLGHYTNIVEDQIPGDRSYWSPGNYWQHMLTVRFKHHIDAENMLFTSPSYYTLHYSLGYEIDREVINSLGFNIFLEMNRHLLLKGNFRYYDSGDLKVNAGMLSIIYRW